MWIESEKMSRWAYYECSKGDNPTIRNLVTDSEWAYWYCKNISDIKKIRDNIIEPYWAFKYCTCIKDRPELREIVKNSPWDYWLTCLEYENLKEIIGDASRN